MRLPRSRRRRAIDSTRAVLHRLAGVIQRAPGLGTPPAKVAYHFNLRSLCQHGRLYSRCRNSPSHAIRTLGFCAGLLLQACVSSSSVKMMAPDGNIRECPRGKSTWQNEALKEQRACMKAYEDAGYVRIDPASLPALPAPLPVAENRHSLSANEAAANPGNEPDPVEQLRHIRDSHQRGLVTDMEYRRRCDAIIDRL